MFIPEGPIIVEVSSKERRPEGECIKEICRSCLSEKRIAYTVLGR